jgi:hypothetical protein
MLGPASPADWSLDTKPADGKYVISQRLLAMYDIHRETYSVVF